MSKGLPVSRLINVSVNLSPLAAQSENFNTLLIAGDSNVIDVAERIRSYNSIEEVAADFGTTAPEYLAAQLYFEQLPQPTQLYIGRWASTATSGLLPCGVLTPVQQAIATWNGITAGAFNVTIDGTVRNVAGLDFSLQTNLNGVASVINTALGSAGGAVWNGENFTITSDSTGAGAFAKGTMTVTANPSPGVNATGTITLTTNPVANDTLTVNGSLITFVASGATGQQVNIAGTAILTAANLQTYLQTSVLAGIVAATYANPGTAVITVTYRTPGVAGNAFTLVRTGTNITVSGATLTGGVAADTLVVNGTTITFVASNPTGNQVLVGPLNTDTAANLNVFLNASIDVNISKADYTLNVNILTAIFNVIGTTGNAFTLVRTGTAITLSGATLSGGATQSTVSYLTPPGSGSDISTMLAGTSATASPPVAGTNAETPLAALVTLDDQATSFYGFMWASPNVQDADQVACAGYLQATVHPHTFGVSIVNTNVLSSTVTTDLASQLKALGYTRTLDQYSEALYCTASFFGRALTVNFAANNSTLTMMYKQEPGIAPENLTATQADTLEAKRCNFYVNYDNNTAILQDGVMAGPAYFDEIYGLDWLQNQIQTNVYNLLYTSATKVPQTDAGTHLIVNAVAAACAQGVNNGLIAPGQWNSTGFGTLNQGDFLPTGYYIYAPPVALQAQSDREARKSVPIQVAVKLAGAIQTVDVIVNVNR